MPPISSTPRPAETDLPDEVLRSIRRILRRISEHSRWLSREIGLTVPQLVCMRAIGVLEESGKREITVALVAAEVSMSAPTVSRILDRMVTAGLVTRERRAIDRRKVCLSLTDLGAERRASLPSALQDRFTDRLSSLPEIRRRELLGALNEIGAMMDADDLVAAPILTEGSDLKPPVEG
ncbi:MAG: DNA-binding MarR family transcriptional regulator [Hyphomicrobiaceae bacterium]